MTTGKNIAEITVSADYRTFRQYFIYSSLRRALPWVNWALMFAAAPAYEIFLAYRMIAGRQQFSSIILLLLGINLLGAAYLLLEPRIVYRRRSKEWEGAPCTYAFEEERFVSSAGEGEDGEEIIAYDALKLVSETRAMFFLHTEDDACVALPKSSMGGAEALDLRALFQEKLGEKFKGRKK